MAKNCIISANKVHGVACSKQVKYFFKQGVSVAKTTASVLLKLKQQQQNSFGYNNPNLLEPTFLNVDLPY